MMTITRRDPFTGELNAEVLPITQDMYDAWQGGAKIQDAMSHLSVDQREFMISGVPVGKWDEYMGAPDDS